MNRTSLVLITTLLAAASCDRSDPSTAEPAPKPTGNLDQAKADATPRPPADDPWQTKLAGRVLADSGIGVGGKLSAFDIVNCDSGEKYCQVCRFGGSPKIMAVGTLDDAGFHEDLKDLDAIVKKYGEDKIKAFAVVTDLAEDGKAKTPADAEAARARAKELKERLALTIPLVVPAPEDTGPNKIWEEYYNITKSRTVMFADGKNQVRYSAVAPPDFAALDQEIRAVVDG